MENFIERKEDMTEKHQLSQESLFFSYLLLCILRINEFILGEHIFGPNLDSWPKMNADAFIRMNSEFR